MLHYAFDQEQLYPLQLHQAGTTLKALAMAFMSPGIVDVRSMQPMGHATIWRSYHQRQ